jgi:hypothetical protein
MVTAGKKCQQLMDARLCGLRLRRRSIRFWANYVRCSLEEFIDG